VIFGRHQEERTRRELRQCGRQWLAAKQPRKVQGHDSPAPQFRAPILMVFTNIGRTRVCQCGKPTMTPALLPWPPFADGGRMEGRRIYRMQDNSDHGHGGEKQRVAVAVVEIRIAEIRRSDGVVYFVVTSSRHSKWNTDRTPAVFLYLINWRGEPCETTNGLKLIARQPREGIASPCRLDRRKYLTGAR